LLRGAPSGLSAKIKLDTLFSFAVQHGQPFSIRAQAWSPPPGFVVMYDPDIAFIRQLEVRFAVQGSGFWRNANEGVWVASGRALLTSHHDVGIDHRFAPHA